MICEKVVSIWSRFHHTTIPGVLVSPTYPVHSRTKNSDLAHFLSNGFPVRRSTLWDRV